MGRHKSLVDKFTDWAIDYFNKNSPVNHSREAKNANGNENNHYQFKIGDRIRRIQDKSLPSKIVFGYLEGNYFLQNRPSSTNKENEEPVKIGIYPKLFIESNFEKLTR